MKVIFYSSLFFLLPMLQPWASDSGFDHRSSSRSQIVAAMKSENVEIAIVELNKVRSMPYPQNVLPLLLDIWNGDKIEELIPLPHIINLEIIRVNIVNTLIQSEKNGYIKLDLKKAHRYVRALAESSDSVIATEAIMSLGYIDDEADAPFIASIVRKQDRRLFHIATLVLAEMCSAKSKEEFARVFSALSNENKNIALNIQSRAVKREEKLKICRAK